MGRRRTGKSLVEMLVVVGIALILLLIVGTMGARVWRAVMSLKGN